MPVEFEADWAGRHACSQDYDEIFIPNSVAVGNTLWWGDLVQPYVKSIQLLDCPSSTRRATYKPATNPQRLCRGDGTNDTPCSATQSYAYGQNTWALTGFARGPAGQSLASIQSPSEVIAFSDALGASPENVAAGAFTLNDHRGQVDTRRHFDQDALNLAFVDGHVKYMKLTATMSANANNADNMWNAIRPAAP